MILAMRTSMRALAILITVFLLAITVPSFAIDYSSGDLMSLVKLEPGQATPERITAILGKPGKVEEGKRKTWWHYEMGATNVVICWSKDDVLEKFSFKNIQAQKPAFDGKSCSKLKSGTTDITQAMKLLGTPKDMTIKKMTQEMHYTYQNSVLRLFFRERVLVDFTLLMQK